MAERRKLTKRVVDAIRPQEKTFVVWDSETPGFGLKVSPTNRRTFVFRYRVGGGRTGRSREPAIGAYGLLTPDAARAIAEKWARVVAEGGDPAGARESFRAAPTMSELFGRYLTDHAAAKKKPSSIRQDEQAISNLLDPAFGRRKVAELTRSEVDRWHKALSGRPYLANRALALLGKALSLAELWGMRPEGTNPARKVGKFTEEKRRRFLGQLELAALGEAIRRHEARPNSGTGNPYALAAIRVLALTGARKSEILALRWGWIEWDAARANLPDSKTGQKTLNLGAPALAIIQSIPAVSQNPNVFVGDRVGSHLVNIDKVWRAVRATAGLILALRSAKAGDLGPLDPEAIEYLEDAIFNSAGKMDSAALAPPSLARVLAVISRADPMKDIRIHDLRHSFASVGANAGLGLPIIGALLGHTQPTTTARYAHLSSDPLRAAADQISGTVAGAMGEAGAPAEVVILKPHR